MRYINKNILTTSITAFFWVLTSSTIFAQLPPTNTAGVGLGHTHFSVPNVAKHREIWKMFGGVEKSSGRLEMLMFPGMYILLTEREPTAASGQTTVNHIGFTINNYAEYKAKLEAIGASYIMDNPDPGGGILADLPDGVRVEFSTIEDQVEPIIFHHSHLSAENQEELRAWYVDVFGAAEGERRNSPSAVFPGGRVDFLLARDTLLPTQGAAIDHIGFEVDDMDAFAAKMARMGIEFDRAPQYIEEINLTIAFITDPAGTYIEITEGLADIK